jgi:hypothetical protein
MADTKGQRYVSAITSRWGLGGIAGVLGIGLIVLVVMAATGFGGTKTQKLKIVDCAAGTPGCASRQAAHFHADFALFIDGNEFNFNQPQFVSTDDDLIAADVHIHPERYTVVHVHYTNTTWARFFDTLGFTFADQSMPGITDGQVCLTMPSGEKHCNGDQGTFKFFVNGVPVNGLAGTNIGDLDRVLISYGTESAAEVAASQVTQVTDQACIPDERCKSRIPPNEPPEQCSISNSTGCAVTG